MTITRKRIEETLEAQRFQASQASRETAELDVLSVVIACHVKIEEGRIDEARAIWIAYRASTRSN